MRNYRENAGGKLRRRKGGAALRMILPLALLILLSLVPVIRASASESEEDGRKYKSLYECLYGEEEKEKTTSTTSPMLTGWEAIRIPEALLNADTESEDGVSSDWDIMDRVLKTEPVEGTIVQTDHTLYTYEEMEEDLYQLAATYPDRMSLHSLTVTADGRQFYMVRVGNPEAEKQIVIEGGIHAREYMTPMLTMAQLEYYLSAYDTGTYEGVTFRELFEEIEFYIIPMANPDGTAISQFGLEGLNHEELRDQVYRIWLNNYNNGLTGQDLATYLRLWKANANGVDLNRNYPVYNWYSVTGRSFPSGYWYKGSEPGTEAETKATMALLEGLSNCQAMISQHSTGSLIYWDCQQWGDVRQTTLTLAKTMSWNTGYGIDYSYAHCDAASTDWATLTLGIPAITIETGINSCPLNLWEYELIWNHCREVWAAAAYLYAG